MVSEAISRFAFSGTDQIKVASQYQTFVERLKQLKTPEEKSKHYIQGIKYILSNKSSYWILGANMLKELMEGDVWKFAVPKDKRDKITKKKFYEEHLLIPQRTAQTYIRIATHYKEMGLKEEDVVLLGVKKVEYLLTESFIKKGAFKGAELIKEIKQLQSKPTTRFLKNPRYKRLYNSITKLPKKEQTQLKKLLVKEWGLK